YPLDGESSSVSSNDDCLGAVGCVKCTDRHAGGGSGALHVPYGPNQSQYPKATGAAKRSESTTSSTPPKPGTASEASLQAQPRLIIDSIRSPSWAVRPMTKP